MTLGFKKFEETISKPGKTSDKRKHYDELVSTLLAWMYSFMKPRFCEDEDEYQTSKKFLFSWLKSREVIDVLGTSDAETVREWVRKVCAHENDFLYYQRKKLRTYHQITTSPHEGTNSWIKSHAAAVKPCHTMLRAGQAMALQSDMKSRQFRHDAGRQVTNSNLPRVL